VSWTNYVALFGWIPVTLLLFVYLPPSRACFASLVFGFLFLPMSSVVVPGLVLSKYTLISLILVPAVLFFDPGRLSTYRFRMWDLPVAVWCIVPAMSSITNDLGANDAIVELVAAIIGYAVPYLLGRLYIRTVEDIGALARTLLIGGLLYVPLCWYEIKMSPQLHRMVYGFFQHAFAQTNRFGGWRPVVFLQNGITLGMWMTCVTVLAYGLWKDRRLQPIAGLPAWAIVAILGITTFFCKSLGSLLLLAFGLGILEIARRFRAPGAILLLTLLVPAYLVSRIVFHWRPDRLVEEVTEIDADRGSSLGVRIESDDLLIEHAMERPLFGWGGWGRNRGKAALTDSFWSIVLAANGLVGLTSVFAILVAAQYAPLQRLRRTRDDREFREVGVCALIIGLYALDCMVNSSPVPVFFTLAGGLVQWGTSPPASWRVPRPMNRGAPSRKDTASG
jgi:hypothetical protein